MKPLLLILLLLVAAAPAQYHLVQLDFSSTASIISVEAFPQPSRGTSQGEWTLQSVDAQGRVLYDQSFDPQTESVTGAVTPLDKYSVVVSTPVGTEEILLVDSLGRIFDRHVFSGSCGDGVCSVSEEAICSKDCLIEDPTSQLFVPDTDVTSGFPLWKVFVIVAGVLLIIVLLIILKHNSKPHHLEGQKRF